jgi:hypothetical protein
LQAGEAGGNEAFAPQSDGMSITVELGGDVLVGGLIVLGGPKDEAATEGECLRRGAGVNQGLELFVVVVGEDDG